MVRPAKKAIAAGMSLTLALGMAPTVAMAAEEADSAIVDQDGGSRDGSGYNKADFYSGQAGQASVISTLSIDTLSASSASVYPMTISQDMLYFGAYEGGTYDRTFSWGDGYHAMGYYQFDHRYGLQNFLIACYNYNPDRYWMFEQFCYVSPAQFTAEDAIRKDGQFTELGNDLIIAWRQAYATAPDEFSRLQDGWAYQQYYLPAETYLASIGISISDRNDAVKGLCWGLSNLFGSSGWKKFVGGVSDGYDWDGVYHYLSEGYRWPGAGLSDDMTDAEFVSVLCDYVVDNVAVFYAGQPQCHEGWRNRYVREKAQCLEIIERTGDTHLPAADGTTDSEEPEASGPETPETPAPEKPQEPSDGEGSGDAQQTEPSEPAPQEPGAGDTQESDVEGGSSDSAGTPNAGDEGSSDGEGDASDADDTVTVPPASNGAVSGTGNEGGQQGGGAPDDDSDGSGAADDDAGSGSDEDESGTTGGIGDGENMPTLDGGSQESGQASSDGGSQESGRQESQAGGESTDEGQSSDADDEAGKTQDGSEGDASRDEGVTGEKGQNTGEDEPAVASEKGGEQTMPQTNDRSAGLVAVLVGGFALAFGIVSGTLRRILGRN